MSGFLKAGRHSYGHWRTIVQALALLPPSSRPAPAPAAAKALRLVVLGDSLTAGLGLPPGKAFPDQLQAALRAKGFDVDVVNAGVSGDTAEDGLARYDWAVPADANALIVELGANDMLRGLPPEATKKALTAILDKAKAAHLPTLIAGMRAAPNLGADYDRAFDAIYPAVAEALRRDPLSVLPRRAWRATPNSTSRTECTRPRRGSPSSSSGSCRRSRTCFAARDRE